MVGVVKKMSKITSRLLMKIAFTHHFTPDSDNLALKHRYTHLFLVTVLAKRSQYCFYDTHKP